MDKVSNFYKQFAGLNADEISNSIAVVGKNETYIAPTTDIQKNSNKNNLNLSDLTVYNDLSKISSSNKIVRHSFFNAEEAQSKLSKDLVELLNIFSSVLDSKEVIPHLSNDEVEIVGIEDSINQIKDMQVQFKNIEKSYKPKIETKLKTSNSKKKNNFNGLILTEESLPMKKGDRFNSNIEALNLLSSISPEDTITRQQALILAKYSGWGGLGDYFKSSNPRNQELKELLGENYREAKASVLSSYYTPSNIIKTCYSILKRLGFEKGKILECSAGTGRFLTYMNRNIYTNSKIHCVEIDPTSSKILSLIHPKAKVHSCGFEETNLEDNDFDLVISNIPFGDIPIYDKNDKDLNKHKFRIHDYFFAKALKKVRPGGIIAFITSAGFMDKKNPEIRKYVGKEAELLGVIRLPNDVFAGTDVVSDIVILKKLEEDREEDVNNGWAIATRVKKFEEGEFYMNQCFFLGDFLYDNMNRTKLSLILGDVRVVSSAYGHKLTVSKSSKFSEDLRKSVNLFPKAYYAPRQDESYLFETDQVLSDLNEALKNAKPWIRDIRTTEFLLLDEELYQKQLLSFTKPILSDSAYPLVYQYAVIKDIVYDIRTNPEVSDKELKVLQDKLNKEFDYFVEKFGHPSSQRVKRALSEDKVGYHLFLALEKVNEVFDKEKDELVTTYSKADIFTKRIIGKSYNPKKPDTLEEAINLSFYSKKEIDLDFISEIMEEDKDAIIKECLKKKLIYYNFEKMKFEDDSEYLSGYTIDKLRYCETLLNKINFPDNETITVLEEKDSFLLNNEKTKQVKQILENAIEDLKANLPEFVTNVEFSFSSTWIPDKVKRDFIVETLNIDKEDENNAIKYVPNVGYEIAIHSHITHSINTVEWGTGKVHAERIIRHALNDTTPRVTYMCDKDTIVDTTATQLAISMVKKWNESFKSYVSSNGELYSELVDLYNERFVRIKEKEQRNFIVDAETNPQIQLRPHQLKAVSRIISSSNSILLNHEVGTGKTFTMVCAAHQLHKISMLKGDKPHKTLFVIPNHLIMSGQFAREYLELYPNANILALTPNDLKMENRRKALNLIANNNFEAVLIPYSVLELIPLRFETVNDMYERDMDELDQALLEFESSGEEMPTYRVEQQIASQKSILSRLNDQYKDQYSIFFEDLGFDSIMVDEAHNFKSLYFFTAKSRVAGVSTSQSLRASNLYNIVRYMRDTKGPSSVVFSTATPITNSVSEMYNFTRYLAPELLDTHYISTFDEWASTFGKIITEVEADVTGRNFKLKERFSKFFNTPELIAIFKQFADVVFTEDVQDIVIPKLVGGKPTVVEVEPSEKMLYFIDDLVDRVKDFENRKSNSKDNMLAICGDGRKLSVSPQLVCIEEDSPKAIEAAQRIFDVYREYPGSTQAVFCDLGVPGKDYSIYTEIKDLLINKGIPENEIAFIHDCGNSPQSRNLMINKFNDGVIRVLFGSTPLLGEGANIQKRLKALHHLDCPWKPSELKQREGRILRFGNPNKEVYIFRYVLKKSFDVFSWQTVERKAKFISQISTGSKDVREIADFSDDSIDYASAKAAASGNPLIIEQATLTNRASELRLLEKNFMSNKYNSKKKSERLRNRIKELEYALKILEKEVQTVKEKDPYIVELETSDFKYSGIDQVMGYFKETKYHPQAYTCFGVKVEFNYKKEQISIGNSGTINATKYSAPGRLYKLLAEIPTLVEKAFADNAKLIEKIISEVEALDIFLGKDFEYQEELVTVNNRLAEIELLMSTKDSDKEKTDERIETNQTA